MFPARPRLLPILLLVRRNSSATATVTGPTIDARGIEPPPSLWTRRGGVDWPIFLGPEPGQQIARDGHPHQVGADSGPRLVWQKQLGTSYGAPTIAAAGCFSSTASATSPGSTA